MTDHTVSVASNWGTIVLFDPGLLQDRVKDSSRWWREDPLGTAERRGGRLALWPISARASSRSYRFRLATEVREDELPFVCGSSEPAPLLVEGEEVFLGPIERLPGDGGGDRLPAIPEQGQLVRLGPGRYSVQVHVLDWQGEERFWNEDNEPTADAPPDFVIEASEVAGELPAAPAEQVPLLELIPRKTPTASTKVRFATRPRPRDEPEPAPRRRRSSSSAGPRRAAEPKRPRAPELQPGELGVGARVRHPSYGIGTVLFFREGFPKVKVSFASREYKVDKDELTVI